MVKTVKKQRAKVGLAAAPMDRGFEQCRMWFHDENDRAMNSKIIKIWIMNAFSRDQVKSILKAPEYHFAMFNSFAAAAHWCIAENPTDDIHTAYVRRMKEYFGGLVGKYDIAEKPVKSGPVKSPQELLRQKINSTIMVDIDDMIEQWSLLQKTDIDLYTLFQKHDLKPMAVSHIKPTIERMLSEYTDAYEKNCEQVQEAYSHISRIELKRRIQVLNRMLSDLDRVAQVVKATRKPRAKKVKPAAQVVSTLKFQKDSPDYGVASIAPDKIVGAKRLYTFNTKTRVLTCMVAETTLSVKGTTITGLDVEQSTAIRLRKPNEVLPVILDRTPKQIEKAIAALTTKPMAPNGRCNADTILLRVANK